MYYLYVIYIYMIGLYGPNGTFYMTLQSRDTPGSPPSLCSGSAWAGDLQIFCCRRTHLVHLGLLSLWISNILMVEYCFLYQEKSITFLFFRASKITSLINPTINQIFYRFVKLPVVRFNKFYLNWLLGTLAMFLLGRQYPNLFECSKIIASEYLPFLE